jgi:hypothetical protein
MAQIFAYIVHKGWGVDDTAAELAVAAAPRSTPRAGDGHCPVRGGTGCRLPGGRQAYPQVWKIDNAALAYPNGEVVRNLLAKVVPAGAIVLLPHDTFGMDLGPGLSDQTGRRLRARRGRHRRAGRRPLKSCARSLPAWSHPCGLCDTFPRAPC